MPEQSPSEEALPEAESTGAEPPLVAPVRRFLETAFAELRRDLVGSFERKLEADRFREEQVDRLHRELQAHRADVLARTRHPVLRSLIRLHDELGRSRERQVAQLAEGGATEKLLQALAGFQEDVEVALEQHGVIAFRVDGEEFDGRKQRVVELVDSPEAERAGRVARRLRPGFAEGETILEKERVVVFRNRPQEGEQG